MKMYKVTMTRGLIFLFALLAVRSAFAQPAYKVYITNESYPTRTTYQFDIWISKTGSGPLDISNLQFGIDINPTWRGTGTITPTIAFNGTVANGNGSSMFSSGLKPTGSN